MDRPRSLTQVATPAGGGPHSERSGTNLHSRSLRQEKARAPAKFVIAPLAPLLAAMAIGIVADRWFVVFESKTLGAIALVLGVIAIFTNRHTRLSSLALVAAFSVIGATWHHYRWSDMAPTTWPGPPRKRQGLRGCAVSCARHAVCDTSAPVLASVQATKTKSRHGSFSISHLLVMASVGTTRPDERSSSSRATGRQSEQARPSRRPARSPRSPHRSILVNSTIVRICSPGNSPAPQRR